VHYADGVGGGGGGGGGTCQLNGYKSATAACTQADSVLSFDAQNIIRRSMSSDTKMVNMLVGSNSSNSGSKFT
jgi:hypothetical protein